MLIVLQCSMILFMFGLRIFVMIRLGLLCTALESLSEQSSSVQRDLLLLCDVLRGVLLRSRSALHMATTVQVAAESLPHPVYIQWLQVERTRICIALSLTKAALRASSGSF
jgi:hypothetical protein